MVLFICHYSYATSTAVIPEKRFHSTSLHHALAGSVPRLSTRGTSVLSQTDIYLVVKKGALIQNSCIRSFAGCADLNLAGLLCLVLQDQWSRQWRFSTANQGSAWVYTSRFGNQVPGTVPSWKKKHKWTVPNSSVLYYAVEKRHKMPSSKTAESNEVLYKGKLRNYIYLIIQ